VIRHDRTRSNRERMRMTHQGSAAILSAIRELTNPTGA
jgi:hypothetical protein